MTREPILFSAQQYEFLQKALFIYAKAAEQQGETEQSHMALKLSSELEQNVHHGEGMSPELRKRFEARISVAQQTGDGQQLTKIMRDFIAAQVRVDPDAARAVANTCMSATIKANMSHAASMFIPIVQQKLVALQTSYMQEGYPPAQVVLDYINDWLKYGQENLAAGDDPWPEDEDLQEPS